MSLDDDALFGDPDALPGLPRKGDVIGGKYRIERVIAVGGMGTILGAEHTELGQRVAIKLMPRRAARSDGAVQRFLREAKTAASIASDHVARVFDVGRLESGAAYMVMEYLEGRTLAEMIFAGGPMPVAEGLDYVLQASVAIAECHARGIVHRDLKPENIMVLEGPGQHGFVKLLDFGISKTDWIQPGTNLRSSLTTTTDVFGTPTHMSPEQVRSTKNVDARTDIWALGVVLYEVLTGLPPFMADSLTALSAMIVGDAPRRPIERRPELPAALDAVVMRCLEKRPEDRPQSVAEFAELLAPFVAGKSLAALERIRATAGGAARQPAPRALPPPPRETMAAWGTTATRRERRRSVVLGASFGALLFVMAIVGWAVVRARAPAPAAAPAPAPAPEPAPSPAPPVASTAAKPPSETPDAAPPRASAAPAPRTPKPRPRPAGGRTGPLDDRF